MADDRGPDGRFLRQPEGANTFQEGNQAHLVHGGGRAVKALSSGTSLIGVAHELELEVRAEIDSDGFVAVMRREAERYLAVARLFHGLILGAKDVADVDRYTKRYGWLASKAWRMLAELREMEAANSATLEGVLAGSVERD